MIDIEKISDEIINSHMKDGNYICPSCGTQTVNPPAVEHVDVSGDKPEIQVWCTYGCGYLWLSKNNDNEK
jgi:hypothetical protein